MILLIVRLPHCGQRIMLQGLGIELAKGLLSGIFACFVFRAYLHMLRHKIEYSSFMAVCRPEIYEHDETDTKRILNELSIPVINLLFQLRFRRNLPTHRISQSIHLLPNEFFSLGSKDAYFITFNLQGNDLLQQKFQRKYEMDEHMQQNLKPSFDSMRLLESFDYIEFNQQANHPAIDATPVFTMKNRASSIKHGSFAQKDSLAIEQDRRVTPKMLSG